MMKLRKWRLVEGAPVFSPRVESPSCWSLGRRVVRGSDFSEDPETGLCLEGMAERVGGTYSGLRADGGLGRWEKASEYPPPRARTPDLDKGRASGQP